MAEAQRDCIGDTVEWLAALVVVIVAGEDQLHPEPFEQGAERVTDVDARAVVATGVGRVVHRGDDPSGIGTSERGLEPRELVRVIGLSRVETHHQEIADLGGVPPVRHPNGRSVGIAVAIAHVVVS